MNEQELAKKIVQRLDQGLGLLKEDTVSRLQSARQAALNRYAEVPEPVFATAGIFQAHHGAYSYARKLLAAGLMVLGLIGVTYWQMLPSDNDVADIDASLLSGDLPINAYLDSDFDAWLNRSSQSQ